MYFEHTYVHTEHPIKCKKILEKDTYVHTKTYEILYPLFR
jgi:hypothetical protein